MRNRSCLVLVLVLVAFWIAFGLFVVAALAAPRREAEFPAQPSSGAPHSERSLAPWQRGRDGVLAVSAGGAPLPSVAPTGDSQPTNASANVSVTGQATWYRYRPGQAAAGPGLRKALGLHWRGSVVTVCARSCVVVTLTDWCLCRGERIVDLDSRSFRALAPLSAGVVRVTVSRLPVAPATDLEEAP